MIFGQKLAATLEAVALKQQGDSGSAFARRFGHVSDTPL